MTDHQSHDDITRAMSNIQVQERTGVPFSSTGLQANVPPAPTPQTIKELVVTHNAHLQVISMCSEHIRGKLFGENPPENTIEAPTESTDDMPIASVLQRNTQLLLQIRNMLEKINDEI